MSSGPSLQRIEPYITLGPEATFGASAGASYPLHGDSGGPDSMLNNRDVVASYNLLSLGSLATVMDRVSQDNGNPADVPAAATGGEVLSGGPSGAPAGPGSATTGEPYSPYTISFVSLFCADSDAPKLASFVCQLSTSLRCMLQHKYWTLFYCTAQHVAHIISMQVQALHSMMMASVA